VPSKYRLRERGAQLYALLTSGDSFRHGSWLFFATILGSAGLYVFHLVASRRLGPESYGVLASLLAIVALIAFSSAVGTTIVARFAAEFHAMREPGRLARLSDLVAWACAIILGLGGVAALALRTQIAIFLHIDTYAIVELTVILTALSIAVALLRGMQQGAQRFSALSLSQLIENVGRAGLGLAGVALGYGVRGALAGQALASAASLVYTFADVRLHFASRPEKMRIDLQRLFVTTLGIASAFFALAMLVHIDIILAKHYLSAYEAGLYGVATLPGRAITTVVAFLPVLVLPKSTARAAEGKSGTGLLLWGIGLAATFSLAGLVVFYFFPLQIVHVIAGGAYDAAAPLVFPYGCAAAMYGLASIAVSYRTGQGRFDFAFPLVLTVIGEVVAIANYHANAADIIRVLIVANGLALVVSLLPLSAMTKRMSQRDR